MVSLAWSIAGLFSEGGSTGCIFREIGIEVRQSAASDASGTYMVASQGPSSARQKAAALGGPEFF
jgi:hypothetical protein